MRILVVEDDPMIGKTLQEALQQDGYAVDWVTDGRAAQEAIATGADGWAADARGVVDALTAAAAALRR